MTLLDPKNDYIFKRLFATAPHLLTALINSVRHEEEPVEVIEVLNPRIDPEELAGKFIVLDVLARRRHRHPPARFRPFHSAGADAAGILVLRAA